VRQRSIITVYNSCTCMSFRYCDQHVCLSVYLSVRSHISKLLRSNFTKFSVHVTCGRGSVLLWRQCDTLCTKNLVHKTGSTLYFRFCGRRHIMFSYNIQQMSENQRWVFRRVHRVAVPGAKLPFFVAKIILRNENDDAFTLENTRTKTVEVP